MATMNISLPGPLKTFAEAQTREGSFANVSDYMRELIRRDQERHRALTEIQAAIDEGVASGPAKAFNMADFVAEKKARIRG